MASLLGLAVSACEAAGGGMERRTAATGAPATTVGTFHAVVDGEERTWYAVAGRADGRTGSSAVWTPLSSTGRRLASLGGFEVPGVPAGPVELDVAAGTMSPADYRGKLLHVAFPFRADDFELTARIPGPAGASVMYLPHVSRGRLELGSAYVLSRGTLEVTRIEVSGDGSARFEGTFSGTFRTMDGEASLEVAGGRFRVERALRRESRPPPGVGPGGG